MTYLHRAHEGGVEKVALSLIDHWARTGAQVILVVAYADGLEHLDRNRNYRLMLAPQSSCPRWLEGLWMFIWLVRCIKTTGPDVLFCPGNSYTISAVLAKLRLGRSCPPILCKISNGFYRPDLSSIAQFIYRRWLRIQAQYIDRFVAIAPPIVDEIVKGMQIDRSRAITICDPSIDTTFLQSTNPKHKLGSEPGSKLFLAVGRLVKQKNYPLLLDAFNLFLSETVGKDHCLVIVGEGPLETELKKMASRLGIADRVNFTGYSADMARWYCSADALLMSSDYEGLPAVLVESLAAGLPIVATNCSTGISALVEHGKDGLVVPVNDPNAFADAIAEVVKLKPESEAMRQKAERYTIENSAPLYLSALENLAAQET